MSFDPGVTTGYAWGVLDDESTFSFMGSGQGKHSPADVYGMLESIRPIFVISESFVFRQSKTGIVLDSRDILGVLRMWTEIRDCKLCLQSASSGKSYYTNDRLRKIGVYKVGSDHARDATRHLLHWVTFGEGNQFMRKDGLLV